MNKNKALFKAIKANDYQSAVRSFNSSFFNLVKGADPNAQDGIGCKPLIYASERQERGDILKFLIEKGADVNCDFCGSTALMRASEYGYINITEFLIARGANIHAKNLYGNDALLLASDKGHEEIVEILIAKGAKINEKNKKGYTPLLSAVFIGQKKIAELLVRNKADVNIKNENGDTPLIIAINKGNHNIVELLIASGADVNLRNGEYSPLIFAMAREDAKMTKYLIDKGADKSYASSKLVERSGKYTSTAVEENILFLLGTIRTIDGEAIKVITEPNSALYYQLKSSLFRNCGTFRTDDKQIIQKAKQVAEKKSRLFLVFNGMEFELLS